MTTKTTDFIICCRRLTGALRQPQRAEGHATFVLGFGADGLPFYKTGGSGPAGGPGEPLFFCPFCGRRVREGGDPNGAANRAAPRRSTRPAAEDGEEELTRPAPARRDDDQDFETFIASCRGSESAPRGGTGRLAGEPPRASLH